MPKFDGVEANSFSTPIKTQAPIGVWATPGASGTQPLVAFRSSAGTVSASINTDGTITSPSIAQSSAILLPSVGGQSGSGSTNFVSQTAYFMYYGRTTKPITSATIAYNMTTNFANDGGTPYAELGIFSGAPVAGLNTGVVLTKISVADMTGSSDWTHAPAIQTKAFSFSTVAAGTDLWVAFGCKATTLTLAFAAVVADKAQVGMFLSKGSTQLSGIATTVGTLDLASNAFLFPNFVLYI